MKMIPYANDADSLAIDGLTIENGTDRITLYGDLTLSRDQAGLARARELHQFLGAALAVLESQDLPAKIQDKPSGDVANPFS